MKRRAIAVALAFGAIVVVALLLFLRSRNAEIARDFGVEAAAIPGANEPALGSSDAAVVLEDEGTDAVERAHVEAPADEPPIVRAAPARATGRVLDLEGAPVAGIVIALRADPERPIATSSADGTFELAKADPELVVTDPRWYTLRDTEPLPRSDGGTETLVVVAPAIAIGGRVQDPDGAPISLAKLELELPWAVFAPFPVPLDRGREIRTAKTYSRSDGSFDLVIPSAARARIVVTEESHAGVTIDAPREARADLVVTLAKPVEREVPHVEGVVVRADGTPSPLAIVRFGEEQRAVDELGRFTMPIVVRDEACPLVAIEQGLQAAVVPDFGAIVRASKEAIPFQRLVLGGPPLAIEGLVVDHEGRPKKGWTVQPLDPVIVVEGRIPPVSAESLASGGKLAATTDAKGAFRLDGLQERTYRLQAHSEAELVSVESEPVAAGSRNVRIVVSPAAWFDELEGVVVAFDGTPIVGVDVRAALIVLRSKWGYTTDHSPVTKTDANGRFRLEKAPRRNSKIDADGDAILPASYDLAEHAVGAPIRIVAARRCHVRVEGVPTTAKVRTVELRDADGAPLQLMQFQSGGWMSSSEVSIEEGGSPVFAVSETARTIVFEGEDGSQVSRALALAPGQITVVRW